MTTRSTEILFKPFRLKGLTRKNRIVMAPLMRSFSPDGVLGEDVANYYRRRADGDVGLILSEGTVVGCPHPRTSQTSPTSAVKLPWKDGRGSSIPFMWPGPHRTAIMARRGFAAPGTRLGSFGAPREARPGSPPRTSPLARV